MNFCVVIFGVHYEYVKNISQKKFLGYFFDIMSLILTQKLQKQWEKIGKTPKKLEKKLIDVSEIQKSVEEAKKVLEWLDSPYCPLDEDFE
jgi:hypothetical protein